MDEPAVRVDGVSKLFRLYHERPTSLKERVVNWRKPSWEELWALRDVHCEIGQAETVGFIGPNGSGKSTLLKLIAGIMRPTEGRIETVGRIASLLELGAGFHPDLTGRENVYMNASILGLTRRQTDRHFQDIVQFAELEDFVDMQVRHYSSGMYVRLGFAIAVHVDPDILIVDEVLAVGDEPFQRKCLDRIRQFQSLGKTIIFVTHAVDLVREICNRALFLHKGCVVERGAPGDVVRAYRRKVHGEAHLEAAPKERRGTREIRITNFEILGASGAERQVFETGEEMTFVLRLEADEPVEDPNVGLQIFDASEQVVYGTNTRMREVSLGTVEGTLSLRMHVPFLALLGGTYTVTVGVATPDDRHVYDWREKMWAFRVVNPGYSTGTTNLDMAIDIHRPPPRLRAEERTLE